MSTIDQTTEHGEEGVERRDFLFIAAGGFGVVAAAGAAWPLIDNMNPSSDVLALGSTEVDLSLIEVGQEIKVKWRGKPVFIRHRSPEDIAAAKAGDSAELIDPQDDAARIVDGHEEWLVLVGVCTHLGCIPSKAANNSGGDVEPVTGKWDGWYCPCHGSYYDTSGRIRKGPAPNNLEVPAYTFLDDNRIKIG